MKVQNRRGFTIVELVIVIAVIAVLAAVLIPTFSGVIQKANQSAAMQTARNTLMNALNMSSSAQLEGPDENGDYKTVFLVDGYAFGYNGNQLESMDYPGADGSAVSTLTYGANYNAILLSSDNIDGTDVLNIGGTIAGASDFSDDIRFVSLNGNYYITDGVTVCAVYVNSDFSKKVVIFTTFAGVGSDISSALKAQIIDASGINGYTEKSSGTGSSVNFGDIH